MSDLPGGWTEARLGEVASTQLGRMLSAHRETGSHARPYLRNRDVQWGHINTTDLPTMDFDPDDQERYALRRGDLLVCEGGEVGRAAIWTAPIEGCYFQKALHRIRATSGVLNQFLRYLLEHYARTNSFGRFTTGSTIAHLPQEDLRLLPVPLPPTGEQKRIVAAIEEQFSRLDVGVTALNSALMRTEQLAKAVLVAAIPAQIPDGWTTTTVDGAGHVQLGRQRSPRYHTGANMKGYLRVANVFEDRIDTSDIMTMHFSEAEYRHYQLMPGDILLNEGQSPHLLGRPAIYRGDPPDVAFTNSLLRFQTRDGILPSWALLVFRHHLHARRFMAESQITTNIAHLSAGRFRSIEFPIPPLKEQQRVVDDVEQRLSLIRAQRSAVERNLTRARQLRSSVLDAAFSGTLAPQDPNDEAAAFLLERIATERASSGGDKSSRAHIRRTTLRRTPNE